MKLGYYSLFALLGVAVIFAGLLGVQYKIIADGVEKGVLAARRRREYRQPEDREGTQSQEGYQSGQSIQDQQGQQRFPDQQGSQAGPDERQDEKNSQG
jgi:hypothetical protein